MGRSRIRGSEVGLRSGSEPRRRQPPLEVEGVVVHGVGHRQHGEVAEEVEEGLPQELAHRRTGPGAEQGEPGAEHQVRADIQQAEAESEDGVQGQQRGPVAPLGPEAPGEGDDPGGEKRPEPAAREGAGQLFLPGRRDTAGKPEEVAFRSGDHRHDGPGRPDRPDCTPTPRVPHPLPPCASAV
jgi:hypothetical protein